MLGRIVQNIERARVGLTRRCVGGLWYIGWKCEGAAATSAEGRVRIELLRGAVKIGGTMKSSRCKMKA